MSSSKSKTALTDLQSDMPATFEAAVAELEALVDNMDSQTLGLDQLLTDYKRGARLVKYCRDRLTQVRQEVTEIEQSLNKTGAEGDQ